MGLWQQMQRAAEKGHRDAIALHKVPPSPPQRKPDPTSIGNMPQGIQPSATASKRGPKPSGNAKRLISLRLDPEVIDGFKATGAGWQGRMNDVLRSHLGL